MFSVIDDKQHAQKRRINTVCIMINIGWADFVLLEVDFVLSEVDKPVSDMGGPCSVGDKIM